MDTAYTTLVTHLIEWEEQGSTVGGGTDRLPHRPRKGHVRVGSATTDMSFINATEYELSSPNCTDGELAAGPAAPRWALVALSVVPVWIFLGNLLVLLAVIWNKHLRTLSNYVIASLAATDFMLAVLVVPLGTYQVVNGRWDLGLVPCLIWTGSDVMLSTASILHLGAIAIHRYLGISYPLHFRNNADKRQILALLVPAWGISVIIALPLIFQGIHNQEHVLIDLEDVGPQCGIFDHVFVIYSSMVSFFVPLAIMVFADVRSVQILRKTSKVAIKSNHLSSKRSKSRSSGVYDNEMSTYEPSTIGRKKSTQQVFMLDKTSTADPDLISDRSSPTITPRSETDLNQCLVQSQRPRKPYKALTYFDMLSGRSMVKLNGRERRAEKTLIWVFVCFVVLWLPFFCTNLTYGVCRTCEIPPDVFLSFTWLGYISSGVNPCIYTFLNKDFRVAFRKIVCRKHCQRTGNSTSVICREGP